MSGMKEHDFAFSQGGVKMTPDEIDRYEFYHVANPATSATYIGTAVGTSTQTPAIGITNAYLDYPRNVVFGLAGSAGLGGTLVLTGNTRFTKNVTETFAVGTAANGGTVAGTHIFTQITGGTVTIATSSVGSGSARVGVAIGTATTDQHLFGLPTKIAGTSDVKMLTWINNGTPTALAGGTSIGTLVGTANHTFRGTSAVALTDRYVVMMKSTFDNASKADFTSI